MSDFEKKILEFKNRLNSTQDSKEIEAIRTDIFSKNGFINSQFKKLGSLSEDEKKTFASNINKAKQELLKIRTDRLKDPTKTLKIVTFPLWQGEGDFGIVIQERFDTDVIIKDENGSELLSVDAHISETVEKAALDFIVVNNMPSFKIDIY